MSEFFKINIYILYIYIYVFCFIACKNTEKFMLKYEDKELHFTLYKGNVIEKSFSEKIKTDGTLTLEMYGYTSNGNKDMEISITNYFVINGIDDDPNNNFHAGDILLYYDYDFYLCFLLEDGNYANAQKVGEIEKSSLDGFNSLFALHSDWKGKNIEVTFSLLPEEEESILKKMITVIVVVISLTLFLIIYLLIQF